MVERIEIKQVDLEHQKNYDVKHSFIELYDDKFHFVIKFIAEERNPENPELGWVKGITAFDNFANKEHITGIEKWYVEKTKVWGIMLCVMGYSYDLKMYFKKESEAEIIFNKLVKWRWNRTT